MQLWKRFRQLEVVQVLRLGRNASIKSVDPNRQEVPVMMVKRAVKFLTTAQLKALAATPIEVIPAPGVGRMLMVVGWRFRLDFVATGFDDAAADGDLILEYNGGTPVIDTMESDGLVDASADTQGLSMALTEILTAESNLENTAVDISNDGTEFTGATADAVAEVEVFYLELDTNPGA